MHKITLLQVQANTSAGYGPISSTTVHMAIFTGLSPSLTELPSLSLWYFEQEELLVVQVF